jgi:hypothetical protein
MRTKFIGATGFLALALAALPAFAHHAAQSQFDLDKAVKVSGTITRVDFINPHGYLYIDQKDDSGKVTKWAFELIGPGGLRKAGLGRGSGAMKIGDPVTVTAAAAKDGTNSGLVRDIKLPDGRDVVLWTTDPNQ